MKTENIYSLFRSNPQVSTDSRQIKAGSIFFALKGGNFDGNSFALSALDEGASYSVVDDKHLAANPRCIVVEDVLKALQNLANYHRKQFNIPLLGITGTNGKTTTKELITAVLSTQLQTKATKGNLNNHIGVPLSLLEIDTDTEFAVIEMGANHPGEIHELCQIAMPNIGIITNIGKAHLEGFGSQDKIIKTKNALYDSVASVPGELFVNGDNTLLMKLSEKYKRYTYGSSRSYNYSGMLSSNSAILEFDFHYKGKAYHVKTKLAGQYNFENAMAAVSLGLFFGIHPENIKTALESYMPENNRSQIVETENNLLILDAYNANPSSMDVSIRSFRNMNYQSEVLIIGDMLELGSQEEEEHKHIISLIKELNFNEVYYVGPVFYRILNHDPSFNVFCDVGQARNYFRSNLLKNKTILIKGSRGTHLELLNDAL